jgi:hypothetical protein
LISYHFEPSNEIGGRRPTALAHFLVREGIRVVVVSAFVADTDKAGNSDIPGIVPIRVDRPRKWLINAIVAYKKRPAPKPDRPTVTGAASPVASDDHSGGILPTLRQAFFRLVYVIDEHKRWAWRASNAAIRAGRTYGASLVLSSAPPTSVLLAGARAARRLRVPYVADLRDPWIEAIGSDHPVSLRLQEYLERQIATQAAAITSTSSGVAALMVKRHPWLGRKMHVVRNGFDSKLSVAERRTGNRLSILFAGELYVGRDPFPFLSAIESLLARPDTDGSRIAVTFMGRASNYGGQSLEAWMKGKRCASIVNIQPQLPQHAVAQAVAEATVLLNLSQEQRLSIPAKTFEHLTAGREMLLLCEDDCETAQLVAGVSGVIQLDPRDSSKLEAALLDLYQRHVVEGRLIAPAGSDLTRFSRDAANEVMLRVMNGVLNRSSGTSVADA